MSIIRCPHCGTANRAGSNFCNSCGVELRPSDEPRPDSAISGLAGTPPTPEESPETSPARPLRTPPFAPRPPAARPPAAEPPDNPPTSLPDLSLEDQPWLRIEFEAEADEGEMDDALAASDELGELPSGLPLPPESAPRLITGIQGLLEPTRLAISGSRAGLSTVQRAAAASFALSADQIRRVRWLMSEAPMLAASPAHRPLPAPPSLHIRWLFLLLGAAVAIPIFLLIPGPGGTPVEWTGVRRAYNSLQSLPPDSTVLLVWAYDPATAGELDLVALPLIHHLLERRPRMAIMSLLPAGPATAQRLLDRARADLRRAGNLTLSAESARPVSFSFLTGGAAVLPLLARDPAAALQGTIGFTPPPFLSGSALTGSEDENTPALVIVLAAEAESVQHWLEMVQPLNDVPVIAVTSAAAGPVLQPYYDSGQLSGLVHGFDGAYHYRAIHQQAGSRIQTPALDTHAAAQSWGQGVLFLLIILGNVLLFLGRPAGE